MARIYDFSSDDMKDVGKLVAKWPKASMAIAPKLKLTTVEDLVQFGKVLATKKGALVMELHALKASYKDNSIGSSLFGNDLTARNRMKVVAGLVAPQMKVQLAMTTLSIHERDGDGGPYIALVLHKAMGQKEILTSKANLKSLGDKVMA